MSNIFSVFEFSIEFYPYQQKAIEVVLDKFHKGKRKFHIVAPPGSGKTIIGLELIRHFGQKAVILSPNTSIQAQWSEKFRNLTLDISSAPGLWKAEDIVSQSKASDAPIISLTYQGFSVKAQEEDKWLHANVLKLFEHLIQSGYKTLVLDECHHLMAHWAETIHHFLKKQPETTILGLTATPPIDRRQDELNLYLSLVGDVDYEIPAPAVIKQGHLAPFQDLIYLVRPNEIESQFILQAHEELRLLVEELEAITELPTLSFWCEHWLLHPQDHRGKPIAIDRLLDRAPDLTISSMRYLKHMSLFPPAIIPWIDEMDSEMEMSDFVRILSAYGRMELEPIQHPFWERLQKALNQVGYQFRQGKFHRSSGAVDKILALSSAKLRAVETILLKEKECLQDHLRALILTDFETTHAPGGRAALKGVLDPEAGGAVAIMRYLTSHRELDELDPILVTGKTLLCDDDFLPQFKKEASLFFEQRQLDITLSFEAIEGFVKITGQGADWKSQTYVLLVTDLLEKGLTHCLIGTRGLFGEGWDCLSLNTLIDLTSVSSYVSVNQIRGRSMRQDPTKERKLSNNWDIVAVMPELEGGFSDLERLLKKHEHFYGISDDGCLEKGVGHIHPLFSQLSHVELLQQMENINKDMLERGENRAKAFKDWKVGEPYRSEEISSLQLRFLPSGPTTQKLNVNYSPLQHKKRLKQTDLVIEKVKQSTKNRWVGLMGGSVLLHVAGQWLGLSIMGDILAANCLILGAGRSWYQWKQVTDELHHSLESNHSDELLKDLCFVIFYALQECEELKPQLSAQDIQIITRHDGSKRIIFHQVTPEESQKLSHNLLELLGVIQDHRYLIELQHTPQILKKNLFGFPKLEVSKTEILGYLPVPRYFGSSRVQADIFLKHFNQRVSPGRILYTRRGEGKILKQKLLRQRPLQIKPRLLKVWE